MKEYQIHILEIVPPGKCVIGKTDSWVRIPLSPLNISKLGIVRSLILLIIINEKGVIKYLFLPQIYLSNIPNTGLSLC